MPKKNKTPESPNIELGKSKPLPNGYFTSAQIRRMRIYQIINDTENMLFTSKMGLELLTSNDPKRVGSGIRITVVFGRHVTNALQRLRSECPDFDEWYQP